MSGSSSSQQKYRYELRFVAARVRPGVIQTDEQLMVAYAQGGKACLDELFRRHAPRLLGVLGSGLAHREDAKDMLQQVFLQVHRHRHDFDPARPFLPWLYTIAFNVKRYYKRTRRRRPEAELSAPVLAALPSAAAEDRAIESSQAVRFALERLAPEAREVVTLHWLAGMSLAEVAQLLGASESAVKVRAHRAYRAMRALIQRDELGVEPSKERESG